MSEIGISSTGPEWFRDPAPEFRPAVFWFWHRIPTQSEIVTQLTDLRNKGVSRVMIQARPALPLEAYLSPEYLRAYRAAAVEAGRQGLRLTLYDEYGWMSGHGGGRTVFNDDSLRERHLFWTSGIVQSGRLQLTVSNIRSPFFGFLGEVGRKWLYEGGGARWGDWEVVLVASHPQTAMSEGDIVSVDAAATIRAAGDTSCRIELELPSSIPAGTAITVFVAGRCLTSRLINYLLPEAAERFAAEVYAPLLEAAGNVADGFFFDHPYAGFYVWDEHRGDLGNSILWDPKKSSRPDAVQLLSLLEDVGPRTAALRAGFLEDYAGRMHQSFFGTLSRWAADRGLGFTGHELLPHVGAWGLQEGLQGFDPRCMPGVDFFGIDAFRSETAVDAADYAPQLSAKLGDSVARANGRKRCIVEQYSTGRETCIAGLAGQWGLTAERFRAQAIRHLLLGARQILLHAVNVTDGIQGDDRLLGPRFDFPPAFNFEPWWEDCPAIFAELSRLSAFLEEGEPIRPVALLYPLESILAGTASPPCAEHFGWWAEALAREGVGYDILDERRLATALGEATRFKTLVLPAVSALGSSASAQAITSFWRSGGTIIASGPTPTGGRMRDGTGASDELAAVLVNGLEKVRLLSRAEKTDISGMVADLARPAFDARLDLGPSWTAVSRLGKTVRVAAFNDQPQPRQLRVSCGSPSLAAQTWNPQTGDVSAAALVSVVDGAASFQIRPQRLLCLSVRESSETGPCSRRPARRDDLAPRPIVLSDEWMLAADARSPMPVAVDRGWETQGFPDFAGTGIYSRTIELALLPEGDAWHLVLPGLRETAECWINGRPVGRHVAGEARFVLPPVQGVVLLELHVRNTAANRYYPETLYWDGKRQPSGLTQPPLLVPVSSS